MLGIVSFATGFFLSFLVRRVPLGRWEIALGSSAAGFVLMSFIGYGFVAFHGAAGQSHTVLVVDLLLPLLVGFLGGLTWPRPSIYLGAEK